MAKRIIKVCERKDESTLSEKVKLRQRRPQDGSNIRK
jgi:hypothetical protein